MSAPFVFLIRPLSLERGFELECEGVLSRPLRVERLFEAVLAAGQVGQGLAAEVHIYDTAGAVVEVMEMNPPAQAPRGGSAPHSLRPG